MVVVDMVLKFLITDKSIMAERSFVPSQVSKCLTTSAFSSNILLQKGPGKFGWSKDESEVSNPNALMQVIGINYCKFYLNKEYFLIQFRDIGHYQQSEKERIIKVNIWLWVSTTSLQSISFDNYVSPLIKLEKL